MREMTNETLAERRKQVTARGRDLAQARAEMGDQMNEQRVELASATEQFEEQLQELDDLEVG